MQADADPPMLDELILALQAGAGDGASATVPELTVEDLLADAGSEVVDLAAILGDGAAREGDSPPVTMMELGSPEWSDSVTSQSFSAAVPGDSPEGGPALPIILSLYGDDPPTN